MPIGGGGVLEEIIVRGRLLGPGGQITLPFGAGGSPVTPPISGTLTPEDLGIAGLAAVALDVPPPPPPTPVPRPTLTLVPKAPPPTIPEIVVKAQRLTGASTAFAAILGSLGSLIIRDISQQRLDLALAEFMAPDPFVPGDTPVIVQRERPIPEITVTATRAEQLRGALKIPPYPTFTPFDPPPLEVTPPLPLEVPLSPPEMFPDLAPPPAPTSPPQEFPEPGPGAVPFSPPGAVPFRLPERGPGIIPFRQPGDFPKPDLRRNPLTRRQRRRVGSITFQPFAGAQLSPEAQADTARKRCKKCKEDKPRTRCYRKMVKESRMPKNDTEFRWAEISCRTGREI